MKNLKGFTLAEVLITLGVIGVVSAMTIPTVIKNYNKKTVAAILKQDYSLIAQALFRAQADYGDISTWGINYYGVSKGINSNDIVKTFTDTYLLPYMKHKNVYYNVALREIGYNKDIKGKNNSIYISRVNSKLPCVIILVNGSSMHVSLNTNGTIYTDWLFFIDVNGAKEPNILGKDVFLFKLEPSKGQNKLIPYTKETNRNNLKSACNSTNANYLNLFCSALIMLDGWELKDDYPW